MSKDCTSCKHQQPSGSDYYNDDGSYNESYYPNPKAGTQQSIPEIDIDEDEIPF